MSNLLQELNKIKFIESQETFNVFRVLRKESDEVQLHSRFIASLLDPSKDNPLRLDSLPLKSFLKQVGSKLKYTEPETEFTLRPGWSSSNWTEDHKIDILIEGKNKEQNFAIIIENKIFATDSNHSDRGQLEGYHRYITGNKSDKLRDKTYKDNQVEVYYLTLDGHKPSSESLGTKEKGYLHVSDTHDKPCSVKCIQYRKEICGWLNELLGLDEVSNRPYVTSAIEQYRDLVSKLAGDVELHKKLADLVGRYPEEAWKMLQGTDESNLLVRKKKDVLWHGIVDFLNELESALNGAGFKIEPRATQIYEAVSNLIFGHKKSDDIYFRIKDNRGFVWTLQFDSHINNFFLGIDSTTNPNEKYKDKLGRESNGWFCNYSKYMTPELHIDINSMSEKDFINIMVLENRHNVIKEYVEQISNEITK